MCHDGLFVFKMTTLRLIVGLGNPGAEYENTRHNAGFWWLDQLAAQHRLVFRQEKQFHGLLTRLRTPEHDVFLLQPQIFMNASGRAVAALVNYYKIEPEQILVVHDELDLSPGVAKLKKAGGHGGHNGLKDIAAHLGVNTFWRLRIGVGHPGDRAEVTNFVLNPPRKEEMSLIEQAMDFSHQVATLMLSGKMDAAMLKLHSQKAK